MKVSQLIDYMNSRGYTHRFLGSLKSIEFRNDVEILRISETGWLRRCNLVRTGPWSWWRPMFYQIYRRPFPTNQLARIALYNYMERR